MLSLFFNQASRLTTWKSQKSFCNQDCNCEETITSNIYAQLRLCAKYNVYILWLYVCLKMLYDYSICWGVEILFNDFIFYVNELKCCLKKSSIIQFCNLSVERSSKHLLVSETRKWLIFEVNKSAFNYNFASTENLRAD